MNTTSGAFVMDSIMAEWNVLFNPLGVKSILEMHDESGFTIYKKLKDIANKLLVQTLINFNTKIKLNVPISISALWGKNYGEIH